jgi:tetratricopeptide (TPR) repeat protein
VLRGAIYEQQNAIPQAMAVYEKVLELNPRFGPAANNLAFLYSECGGDKEKALALAPRAIQELPDNPHASDTLGWILYKRGVYEQALNLFTDSAAKLPDNPAIQYHLGMAHYKLGNREAAKQAFAKDLQSNIQFPEFEDARQKLAELR